MSWLLAPDCYGVRANGHCGHCNGRPEHQAHSDWGIFCLACCRWLVYAGPPQRWGDGMGTPVKELR